MSELQTTEPLSPLEEIKLLALTMGAPGECPVPAGLARIVRICRDGGAVAKLAELGERANGK